MNNRIKELERQADEYADGLGLAGDEWCDAQSTRFAELIVRECTNMLPADTIRNEDGVHMFYVIREHFGVPTIGR